MSTIANKFHWNATFQYAPPGPTDKWESRFHTLMMGAAAVAVAISWLGYHYSKLTISFSQAIPTLLLLFFLFVVAAQYRWRNEPKCFNVVMMTSWVVAITNLHFFPMYMAARQNVEMSDALLAKLDRALGIEVPAVLEMLKPYPVFNDLMLFVYSSLIPLMTLATIVPPLCGRMDKAKEFALGCMVAASLSMPIFACFQAVGPWDYYGFTPAFPSLANKAAMLASLKTNAWFVIDLSNRDGLITFPSFHVVLTVLAAAALWPIRYLRWLTSGWAALIVVSTVTTGIHYTTDVLGGFLVALIAYAGAKAFLRWESRIKGVRNLFVLQRQKGS